MPLQMTKREWASSMIRKGKPLLVQVGEKHESYTYLVTNQSELSDACLAIVSDRRDYYYRPEEPQPPSLSDEQIAAIPDGPVKLAALNDVARAIGDRQRFRREIAEWSLVEKARAGDWVSAFDLLCSRDSHEYEGFDVVEAQRPPKFKRTA